MPISELNFHQSNTQSAYSNSDFFPVPNQWLPSSKIQEQQWLAETLGGLHPALPFLPQELPRHLPIG